MNKALLIIIVLIALSIAGFIYYKRIPYVSHENVDWLARTVKFTISANGKTFSDTIKMGEPARVMDAGNYDLVASPEGRSIIIAVTDKAGLVVKGTRINFETQAITPLEKNYKPVY